jgi:endonuclease/exonuclease/phosphatase family metal-dependent hydrolase
MVSGRVSVMALQEVGVNGRNTHGRDNNEEILEEVFRQELPREFRGADIDKVSLDANGQPVMRDGKPIYSPERYADSRYTATNDKGATRNMTLTRDRFDSQGREVPFDTSAEKAPTVAYSAHLEEQDKTYSLTYAANNKEGSYGNSVLLAPGYEVEDAQQQVLGHDPDGEQRSALAVTFRTPDGQEGTAISAHLSNGREQDQGEARVTQLRTLSRFSEAYDNTVILGDYNTYPGQEYGRGLLDFLPFVDPDKTPSASSLGFVDPDRGVRHIDRIFTQGDVSVGPRNEFEESAGGSDHPLVTWDVTL